MDQEFVQFVLLQGLLTPEQIQLCRKLQQRSKEGGLPASLWEMTVQKGFLTYEKTQEILRFLKNRMETALDFPSSSEMEGLMDISNLTNFHLPGYQLESLLGKGAMGAVYKARRIGHNQIVAMKVLYPEISSNPKSVLRLKREAQSLSQLNHPHIVGAVDFGAYQGMYYLVMEYVEGKTIAQLLEGGKIFSEKEILSLIIAMARALDHANSQGFIHRDIKPANIIIHKKRGPKLCDLGLVKGEDDSSITTTGTLLGTPFYMSPEMIQGLANVDIRTDLYSLGATVFHMATGHPPFYTQSPAELIGRILSPEAPSPKALQPDLSPWLDQLIQKMMAKDREHRFQSPRELLYQLEPP